MKHSLNCEICKVNFLSSWKDVKTCSDKCRKKRYKQKYGRYSNTDLTSGTIGAISELRVALDLMKKGYATFRALSPSCDCDLVIFKGEKIKRVEVKTGYITTKGSIFHPNPLKDTYDVMAVYIRSKDKVFYLDKNKKQLSL